MTSVEPAHTPPQPQGCPFCLSSNVTVFRTSASTQLYCGDCGAQGPAIHSPQADWDAIEAWNRRAAPVADPVLGGGAVATVGPNHQGAVVLRVYGVQVKRAMTNSSGFMTKLAAEINRRANRPFVPADRYAAALERVQDRRRGRLAAGGLTPAEAQAAVDAAVAEYMADYELRTDEVDYLPNETERMLIEDAISGLLADDGFLVVMRHWLLCRDAKQTTAESAPKLEREPWVPYLSDRADGVQGHYAIARHNPAGYREVWNLRGHGWSAASDGALTLEQARDFMRRMVISAPQAPDWRPPEPLRCKGCGKTIAEHGPLLNCWPRGASPATQDVLAERQRQVCGEGHTTAHDDEHADGSIARAAAAYAIQAELDGGKVGEWRTPRLRGAIRELWPWEPTWWKPKDRRSNLVRAGALILAEIERLDRAEEKPADEQSDK